MGKEGPFNKSAKGYLMRSPVLELMSMHNILMSLEKNKT